MNGDGRQILIFGAGGRLGAALARSYSGKHDVLALGRAGGDLSAPDRAADIVRRKKPGVVINCAAMTNVDVCETERDLARIVNQEAPAALARACGETGARLVQISTDYVFSGWSREPYAEDAVPDPISWYGRTKLMGESAVLAAGEHHAVVRVSWVFGPDRDSFVDKALQSALRGDPVKAVADKWSSPTYTLDVADALAALFSPASPGGIYHVCNAGICTWQDWAAEGIRAAAAAGVAVKTQEVEPLELAEITAMVAARPVYSPMSCARIEALLGRAMRPWQAAVADYVRLLAAEGRFG